MENTSHTTPPRHPKPPVDKGRSMRSRPLVIAAILLVALIVLWLLFFRGVKDQAKYEDSNQKATASFELDVDYKKNCKDQKDCDPNKPAYDFKLFVFNKQGIQVRVVRADDKGGFKASLPEGDYVLVTAKTFEGKKGLPQETVVLKNGKLLKMKVDYGTEMAQPK